MCGITGLLQTNSEAIDRDFLVDCCNSIKHRGPDHTGYYFDGPFAFGMNRLSIIDLERGQQPMTSDNERFVIIFNGEIYNYRELRSTLQNEFTFQTNSDTEVILNSFCKWGTGALKKFNGIFAIAIWDRLERKLILARDPLGVKPLYYQNDRDRFFFSSEVKTFTSLHQANKVSPRAVLQYLTSGYVYHPFTAIEGVWQVQPGAVMTVSNELCIQIEQFADLPDLHCQTSLKPQELVEYINKELDDAIIRQTVSDVPIGLLLSGGLDSMHILSALNKHGMLDNLKTFTANFDDPSFSEGEIVRRVSRELNVSNYQVQLTSEMVCDSVEDMGYVFDNLEFMPTSIAMFFACRMAGLHNKVVFSGIGGDELFLGYPTYRATQFHQRIAAFAFLLSPFRAVMDSCSQSSSYLSSGEKIRRFLSGCQLETDLAHLNWRHIFSFQEMGKLISPDYATVNPYEILEPQFCHYSKAEELGYQGMDRFLYVDMKTWLIDHGLSLWDKAGMHASLEIRVPFLDIEFIKAVLRIPVTMRSPKIGDKYVLRKMLSGPLYRYIAARPKKGFQVPVARWLRYELKDIFRGLTMSLPKYVFSHRVIERMWTEYLEGGKNQYALPLWCLGCLSVWAKKHAAVW